MNLKKSGKTGPAPILKKGINVLNSLCFKKQGIYLEDPLRHIQKMSFGSTFARHTHMWYENNFSFNFASKGFQKINFNFCQKSLNKMNFSIIAIKLTQN